MNDYISRQAAIDALGKHEESQGHNYSMFRSVVSECAEIILDLPSAEPKTVKWIPVTERLPKETGLYLVSLKTKGVGLFEETHPDGFVYVSAYDAVIMHWGYGDKNVQAWQPLPEPYQEADHDSD